jgi:hypothetical protein
VTGGKEKRRRITIAQDRGFGIERKKKIIGGFPKKRGRASFDLDSREYVNARAAERRQDEIATAEEK